MLSSVLLVVQLLVAVLAQGTDSILARFPDQHKKSLQISAGRLATKSVAACQFTSAIIC
jgi:hypothetical protein